MNELDQLRAEAEQLKNAIRVRLSGHNQGPDFLENKLSRSLKSFSHERNRDKKSEQCCKKSIIDLVNTNIFQIAEWQMSPFFLKFIIQE